MDDNTFQRGGHTRHPSAWYGSALLCGGGLEAWQGAPVLAMVRMDMDGSRDLLCNSGASTCFGIIDLALQPDGRVLICGTKGLERFTENGAVDPTFGTGPNF